MRIRSLFTLTCAGLCCAGSLSALTFEEGLAGIADFSTDPLTPTALSFDVGMNTVIGSVTNAGDTRDYFTFTVGVGQLLTDIRVVNYQTFTGGSSTPDTVANTGFAHIDDGTTSVIPGGGTITAFLGGSHINATVSPSSINLLERLSTAPQGGTGFTAPLGPGDYTFNIQQTGPQLSEYELAFTLVPEPGTYAAVAGVLALGLDIVRRRLHRTA